MNFILSAMVLALVPLLFACNPDPKNLKSGHAQQEIFVALSDDLPTLDPRLVRSTSSVTIEHMLFEGLMRTNHAGRIVPAIAESVSVSDQGRRYTFTLRDTSWSDGTPVTAHDFEYSWKSVLDPAFPAPNACQLYVIKGAKAAKHGEAPLDTIGVRALDDKILEVTLEEPTPYFLELAATHFLVPVNRAQADRQKTNSQTQSENIIGNGPFMLSSWKRNDEIVFVKNPNYWDHENVRLEKIAFVITDETTALHMFERGQLDWVGSPLSLIPPDAVAALKEQKQLVITPADGTHWFRVNTEKHPLNNSNIRKALAYAIDRKALVDHITQANQIPATGIVPLQYGLQTRPYFEDNATVRAWSHFQEGLRELQISKDDLPPISLCYTPHERYHKIAQAVQRQWVDALGVEVRLETCESSIFFDKLNNHDYQISFGSWFGDISDPINFLDVFKFKESKTNNTQWENADYIALLDASSKDSDGIQRRELLAKAEEVIIDAMPVIPLYHATFNHMSHGIVGVYFSSLGYLDFTYAFRSDF